MTRPFSIFVAPFYAFYSRSLYRDVGARWRGVTFAYLLLLLAVCWIPFMIEAYFTGRDILAHEVPDLTRQIPTITIEAGRVSVDVEQPHYIRTARSGEVLAIIDTTGEITSLEGVDARLLLTASELIARKNDAETRVYDLGSVTRFYMDGPTFERWVRILGTWGYVLMYPVVIVGSYVYRIVQALLYSLVGLAVARALQCPLGYGGILSVALVALTPAVVVKTVLRAADVSFPLSWLFYFGIAVGYLVFGLVANTEPTSTEPHSAY